MSKEKIPNNQIKIDFEHPINEQAETIKILEPTDSKGRNKEKIMELLRLTDIGAANKGLLFDDQTKEWMLEGKSADRWKSDDDEFEDKPMPWFQK